MLGTLRCAQMVYSNGGLDVQLYSLAHVPSLSQELPNTAIIYVCELSQIYVILNVHYAFAV